MILQTPTFEVIRPGTVGFKEGLFIVDRPMRYCWIVKNTMVEVPKGFLTDFASIPKALRVFISVNGLTALPATLHDYLYSGEAGELPNGIKYTRAEADLEFYRAMILEGVPKVKARMFYCAVRRFGQFHTGLK